MKKKIIFFLLSALMLFPLVSSAWTSDLDNGLIAYWDFNHSSNDQLGRHNLTAQGSITYGSGLSNASANSTGSIFFNSSQGSSDFNFLDKNFSINFWVRSSINTIGAVFQVSRDMSSAGEWGVFSRGDWSEIQATEQANPGRGIEGAIGYNNASWHMITITRESANTTGGRIYMDGVLKNISSFGRNLTSSDGEYKLFRSELAGTTYLTGGLDEFGIWNNTVLNQSQINVLYNSGASTPRIVSAGASDNEYPYFRNELLSPINNSNWTDSTTWTFQINVSSSNGTVILQFNNTNFSASNSTGIFSTTVTVPKLSNVSYPYFWTSWGNGTSKNLNTSLLLYYYVGSNSTFIIQQPMTLNTTLLNPLNLSTLTSLPIIFNFTANVTNGNLTNATLYLWWSNTSLNNKYYSIISGTTSIKSNFSLNLADGSYIFNVYSCAENTSSTSCTFFNSNHSFSVDASPECHTLTVRNINASIPNFIFPIIINNTLSSKINITSWKNIQFYSNSSCGGQTIPFDLVFNNSNFSKFYLKYNLSANLENNFSFQIRSPSVIFNYSSLVWSDYMSVYTLGEGNGTKIYDRSPSSLNVSALVNTLEGTNFTWYNSDFYGFGINMSGFGCFIGDRNLTSPLVSNNLSIMVWGSRIGNSIASDQHGDLVSLGYASANNRFAIRAYNAGTWGIAGNGGGNDWDTLVNHNNSFIFHYVQMFNQNVTWKQNVNTYLGNFTHNYAITQAPVGLGCAYWSSYTARWNGTFEEVRISNITFSDDYINRTSFNRNSSYFVIDGYLSESGIVSFSNLTLNYSGSGMGVDKNFIWVNHTLDDKPVYKFAYDHPLLTIGLLIGIMSLTGAITSRRKK